MKAIERLFMFFETKSLKHTPVEKDLGLTNSYLGKMRDRKGSIGSDILEKIFCKFPELSPDWLITGNGSMLRDNKIREESKLDTSPISKPDESILYNMYKDLQAEKEKLRLEKESEIKELNAKMLAMSEEIGRLKALVGDEAFEEHPEGLGKGTAENASTKKPSSQSLYDAPFAAAPSDGQ